MKTESEQRAVATDEESVIIATRLLIQNDLGIPNILRDIFLYYVSGCIVRYLHGKLECKNCRSELLLDTNDYHAYKM